MKQGMGLLHYPKEFFIQEEQPEEYKETTPAKIDTHNDKALSVKSQVCFMFVCEV